MNLKRISKSLSILTAGAAAYCALTAAPARAATLSFVQNFFAGGDFSVPCASRRWIARGDEVFVADGGNNSIDEFNPTNFAGTFQRFTGSFGAPSGVTVDSAGNVYFAEHTGERVGAFNLANPAGTAAVFGTNGSGSGQFFDPYGMAVDSAGNVYVADSSNNRIVRFNPSNFAGTFTTFGSGVFSGVSGVAVDSAGNVWVSDSGNNRIVRFNPSNFAGTFTSFGSATRSRPVQFTWQVSRWTARGTSTSPRRTGPASMRSIRRISWARSPPSVRPVPATGNSPRRRVSPWTVWATSSSPTRATIASWSWLAAVLFEPASGGAALAWCRPMLAGFNVQGAPGRDSASGAPAGREQLRNYARTNKRSTSVGAF